MGEGGNNFSKEREKDLSRWVPRRPGSKGVELASSVAFVLQANFEREKNIGKENIESYQLL